MYAFTLVINPLYLIYFYHPHQSVRSPATEQEQTFLVQMTAKLLCHNSCKPIDAKTKSGIATGNVEIPDFGQINHRD